MKQVLSDESNINSGKYHGLIPPTSVTAYTKNKYTMPPNMIHQIGLSQKYAIKSGNITSTETITPTQSHISPSINALNAIAAHKRTGDDNIDQLLQLTAYDLDEDNDKRNNNVHSNSNRKRMSQQTNTMSTATTPVPYS
eukprot:380048_1